MWKRNKAAPEPSQKCNRIRMPKGFGFLAAVLHLQVAQICNEQRFRRAAKKASIGRGLTAVVLSLALCGCIGTRPDEASCPAVAEHASSQSDLSTRLDKLRHHFEKADPVNVLLLSGGGAWGAYGAGFLNGWSSRDDGLKRPQFDVVTGVSTGAIIAPFALLGPAYDHTLLQAYRGSDDKGLYRSRNPLTMPFWNSLAIPDKLETRLKENLTNDVLAGMAQAASAGRGVWVGSVNADTGNFAEFDLTALAAGLPVDAARTAIADRIMAASAVPAAFPPRFVDRCMFVDGGVRQNLFISEIGDAIAGVPDRPSRPAQQVTIYAIVNGPVVPPAAITKNALMDIAIRALDLETYQVQIASLREVYDYAKQHHFAFYWTSGDDVAPMNSPTRADQCIAPKDPRSTFNASFTACLFDAANLKAKSSPTPWRTDRP